LNKAFRLTRPYIPLTDSIPMVRPRDKNKESEVIEWYYLHEENKGKTAKHFGIHRSTIGRWIAEFEGSKKYSFERGILKNRYSGLESGAFSVWLNIDDVAKLLKIASNNDVTLSKLIVEITADYLGVDFDE
jgi:hypothetical protein